MKVLDKIDKGEYVNRWEIFRNRKEIRRKLVLKKYKHLKNKVELLIDNARESL